MIGRLSTPVLVGFAMLVSLVETGVSVATPVKHEIAGLPKARYSSETGFGVGLKLKSFSAGTTSGVQTSIETSAFYTQKEQYEGRIDAVCKDPRSDVEVRIVLNMRTLPERFYGIGPDTPSEDEEVFKPNRHRFHTTFSTNIWQHLKVGVRYEFENIEISELDPDGALATSGLSGITGASVSGLGLIVGRDTRDNSGQPKTGSYHQLYALRFAEWLNSTHNFDNFIADLRWYLPLHHNGTLAVQAFVYHVEGDAPFTRLSSIGGRVHSRGYRRGRFLDKSLFALQGEYRRELNESLEFVVFGGTAQVTDGVRKIRLLSTKPTVGVGIRHQPSFSPVRGRLDVAVGIRSIRYSVGFGQAF